MVYLKLFSVLTCAMSDKISCILVEDEPLAQEKLRDFISRISWLELCGAFHSGMDALRFMQQQSVQLLFLDIHMEGINGIQLLESLAYKPRIILTTAYSNYATRAFDLQVDDYLLKPYSFERFLQAVQKACGAEPPVNAQNSEPCDFIFIKTDYRYVKVLLADILYIEGMRDYRCLVTTTGRILTLTTFSELSEKLPHTLFARTHKSYIVALRHIKSVEHHRITVGDQVVPISEGYRGLFYKAINV